jgi:transcription antitermination factor NusG
MRTDPKYNLVQPTRKLLSYNWYAVYTRPQHEKKIFIQLQRQNINAYLPLKTTIRHWSDRRKKVSLPLFSCYLFVNITLKDYYKVLNIPGIVRYVTFEGKAIAIPERQLQMIRNLLAYDEETTEISVPRTIGTMVKIVKGPLTGISGKLIEFAGKKRVVISIEEIGKCIMVNIPLKFLMIEGKNE